jgi:hypothetical protein
MIGCLIIFVLLFCNWWASQSQVYCINQLAQSFTLYNIFLTVLLIFFLSWHFCYVVTVAVFYYKYLELSQKTISIFLYNIYLLWQKLYTFEKKYLSELSCPPFTLYVYNGKSCVSSCTTIKKIFVSLLADRF